MFSRLVNVLNATRDGDMWPLLADIASSIGDTTSRKEEMHYVTVCKDLSTRHVRLYPQTAQVLV
jgi:hypothetical protein